MDRNLLRLGFAWSHQLREIDSLKTICEWLGVRGMQQVYISACGDVNGSLVRVHVQLMWEPCGDGECPTYKRQAVLDVPEVQ